MRKNKLHYVKIGLIVLLSVFVLCLLYGVITNIIILNSTQNKMYSVLLIVIVILAVLLCFVVTIQNSKGGGLASGFASGNQVMGAPKTADFLEKTTWGLICVIALLSVFAVGAHKSMTAASAEESQVIERAADEVGALQQAAAPAFGEDEAEEAE